tara:strand:- start:1094 stop:1222 length:129 start_codon:yes stop_codon:yes gene_type:complete
MNQTDRLYERPMLLGDMFILGVFIFSVPKVKGTGETMLPMEK